MHLHSMHCPEVSNCWLICSVILPNVQAFSWESSTADFKSGSIMESSFEATSECQKNVTFLICESSAISLTASEINGAASFAAIINRSASIAYVFRLPNLNATIDFRTVRIFHDSRCIIKVHRAHAFVARMRRRFKFLTQMIDVVVMKALWQRGDLFLVCVEVQC